MLLRRTETQGGDRGFAIEEIGTAGIDDEETRYSQSFGFFHGLHDPVEVALKTDLGAERIGVLRAVGGSEGGIEFDGLEVSTQVCVTRLGGGFAWSHAQVFADDSVETKCGVLREWIGNWGQYPTCGRNVRNLKLCHSPEKVNEPYFVVNWKVFIAA